MHTSIRAITFDVGGTLIDPWPSVGDIYAQVAAEHDYEGRFTAEELNHRFMSVWRAKGDFDDSRAGWSDIVSKTFQSSLEAGQELGFFGVLYEKFAYPGVWKIHDDVVPALKTLRERGLKLGIISNWDERLRPLLERLHLDEFFDMIIISSEVGCRKPSPNIFAHAVEKLGVAPTRILHVGDQITEDAQGAQSSGLQSLLLRRAAEVAARGVIRSLNELEKSDLNP